MKVKFTYKRAHGDDVDLVATVDSATTVGDLAEHLRVSDPSGTGEPTVVSSGRPTLTLQRQHSVALDPDVLVSDSPLFSGARVSLGMSGTMFSGDGGAAPAATVRILNGPDVGKEFSLPMGSSIVGRDATCDVILSDPLVSRRHARINVTDVVEVIDLSSANGISIGTSTVPRATLRPSDVVGIGDTELAIRVVNTISGSEATVVSDFNRSPRLEPFYSGRTYEAPETPERIRPNRFPVIALIAPLIMGAVLYAVTENVLSLLFIALSPVMLVGTAVESRIAAKKDFAKAVEEFESDLEGLRADMVDELEIERRRRVEELPMATACIDAIQSRTPLMWTRRPDGPGFAHVAMGLGKLPSRSTVEYPKSLRSPHHLKGRALEVLGPCALVGEVPVPARFADGAVGVAGPRSVSAGLSRSLVLQLASLHSPSELILCGFFSSESAPGWDWLKWLPHTSSPHSPIAGHHLPATAGDSLALLAEMENLVAERAADDAVRLPLLVLLVEADAIPSERARLVSLAERGGDAGVHVLWLAQEQALLPAACKTFARVDTAGGPGAIGFVHSGLEVHSVVFDGVTAEQALGAARAMAPLVDAGAPVADYSDLPRSVTQFSLIGTDLADDRTAIVERWQQNHSILTGPYSPVEPSRRVGTLRAVIGQSSVGPHALDLRADGPHALVGGTTGAGKSELLQAWILSMAAAHSPQRVTFLLVDYKGGAAFADCEKLPHCVGLVTDLSPHMVRRALTSLGAELKFREELLREHDAKDLPALEAQGFVGAPPSLVVVVDEFAALADEVPEFVDGMIDVAQRGRSLGIHLIMATQRPTGVITGNLRANTNLRLALRLADEADSVDILGTEVAATFNPDTPGRAVSKSGPGRLVPFQASYAGGWTTSEREVPAILVQELTLAAATTWEPPAGEPIERDRNATDIKRLVASIRGAVVAADLPDPRKPWQPVLPATRSLAHVHRDGVDTALTFGVADDPERQRQIAVAFQPDRDGSMVAYGTGGSGKSTFLRTIAIAAGLTMYGGPCHVYGLDFGSRGLSMLTELPHVGSIIQGADHERVTRLLGWLRAEIDERAQRFSQHNAGSLTQYRDEAKRPDEPRILLLIDGIAAFRNAYDTSDRIRWVDMLASIASEGRMVGVHVVMTSETRSGLTTALASSVQRRLVFRLASDEDYAMLGVEQDVLNAKSPPGRGVIDGLEVQVAVLGGTPDPVNQAAEVDNLAKAMRNAGRRFAPKIQKLAEKVALDSLPAIPFAVPVGIASDTLEVLALQPKGPFLLTGAARSGRSTALEVMATSFARTFPGAELHYFGTRRSAVAHLPCWTTRSIGIEEIQATAQDVTTRLGSDGAPRTAIFIEAAGDYVSSPAEQALQQLVRVCANEEHWFVAEGELSSVTTSQGFLAQVKAAREGLLLQPDPESGQGLLKTPLGRIHRSEFPVGRGVYISAGQFRIVQVAMPGAEGEG